MIANTTHRCHTHKYDAQGTFIVGINVEQHSKLNEKRSSIVYSYVTKEVDKYSRDVEEKIKIELNLNKQEYSYVWNVREKEYNTYDKVQ